MSQKKAKEKRRDEKEEVKEAAKPIGRVVIDVYPDMNVTVSNFPSDHNTAMAIMLNATMRVSHYFTQPKEESNILLARPAASPADIIQMAGGK